MAQGHSPLIGNVTLNLFHLARLDREILLPFCNLRLRRVGVHDDEIASRAAERRFSWKKHPEQINLELIRVFLSDAKKNDLVIGSGRTGWRLTQRGLKWAEEVSERTGEIDSTRTRAQSRAGSIDEQRWRRERSRIIATRAWQLWTSGVRDIPSAETKQVFRIDSYARGELRETKITRLRAMFSDDRELAPFLDHLIEDLNREATA